MERFLFQISIGIEYCPLKWSVSVISSVSQFQRQSLCQFSLLQSWGLLSALLTLKLAFHWQGSYWILGISRSFYQEYAVKHMHLFFIVKWKTAFPPVSGFLTSYPLGKLLESFWMLCCLATSFPLASLIFPLTESFLLIYVLPYYKREISLSTTVSTNFCQFFRFSV